MQGITFAFAEYLLSKYNLKGSSTCLGYIKISGTPYVESLVNTNMSSAYKSSLCSILAHAICLNKREVFDVTESSSIAKLNNWEKSGHK